MCGSVAFASFEGPVNIGARFEPGPTKVVKAFQRQDNLNRSTIPSDIRHALVAASSHGGKHSLSVLSSAQTPQPGVTLDACIAADSPVVLSLILCAWVILLNFAGPSLVGPACGACRYPFYSFSRRTH